MSPYNREHEADGLTIVYFMIAVALVAFVFLVFRIHVEGLIP
jgi:hypothetical protein